MASITIHKHAVKLSDWQRAQVLHIKSQYRMAGLDRNYAELLAVHYPGEYDTRAAKMRVYQVWNSKRFDEQIANRLHEIITNLNVEI